MIIIEKINTYLNGKHHGSKRSNLCRSEISKKKLEFPSKKNTNSNSKSGWHI